MPRPAKIWRRKGRNGFYATIRGRKVYLGEDREEAEREFHRLKAAGRPVERSKITTGIMVDTFLADAAKRIRPHTLINYHYYLDRWRRHAKDICLIDLKPFHVTQWIAKYPDWGESTQHTAIGTVRTWVRWCHDQGYIDSDPLVRIKRPPMGHRKPAKPEKIREFLVRIKSPTFLDFCLVLFDTGARPGEIRTISISNVDCNLSIARVVGKRGERSISLTARALAILRRYGDLYPEGPCLRTRFGNPWSESSLRARFRGSGLVSYHLRHDFWGRAVRAGVDSIVVARQMGHKDLKMLTERYAHVETDQTKQAVELAAVALDNTSEAFPQTEPEQADPPSLPAPVRQRGSSRRTRAGRSRKT